MQPTQSRCRSCNEAKKLVRSHVVPESFCKPFVREGKAAKILAPHEYVKVSHTGIYDQTILCDECEQLLSAPDDYAQKLLHLHIVEFEAIMVAGELVAERIVDYDYALLHRFILAVLWRASVSTHDFFKEVYLGPHEDKIRRIVFGGESANNEYPFVAGRLVHVTKNNIMPAPIRERIDDTNYWRIYAGDFHFWVKVDSGRLTPNSFAELQASSGNPLIFLCRDLAGSPEYRAAITAVKLRKVGRASPG